MGFQIDRLFYFIYILGLRCGLMYKGYSVVTLLSMDKRYYILIKIIERFA